MRDNVQKSRKGHVIIILCVPTSSELQKGEKKAIRGKPLNLPFSFFAMRRDIGMFFYDNSFFYEYFQV